MTLLEAYEMYAKIIKCKTSELSSFEKQQALLHAILEGHSIIDDGLFIPQIIPGKE